MLAGIATSSLCLAPAEGSGQVIGGRAEPFPCEGLGLPGPSWALVAPHTPGTSPGLVGAPPAPSAAASLMGAALPPCKGQLGAGEPSVAAVPLSSMEPCSAGGKDVRVPAAHPALVAEPQGRKDTVCQPGSCVLREFISAHRGGLGIAGGCCPWSLRSLERPGPSRSHLALALPRHWAETRALLPGGAPVGHPPGPGRAGGCRSFPPPAPSSPGGVQELAPGRQPWVWTGPPGRGWAGGHRAGGRSAPPRCHGRRASR